MALNPFASRLSLCIKCDTDFFPQGGCHRGPACHHHHVCDVSHRWSATLAAHGTSPDIIYTFLTSSPSTHHLEHRTQNIEQPPLPFPDVDILFLDTGCLVSPLPEARLNERMRKVNMGIRHHGNVSHGGVRCPTATPSVSSYPTLEALACLELFPVQSGDALERMCSHVLPPPPLGNQSCRVVVLLAI